MLRLLGTRTLVARDEASVLRAMAADPVGTCLIGARVEEFGLGPTFPGEMWSRGRAADSLCYSGANLVPMRGNSDDLRAFADRAARTPRWCSSVVGRAELALPLWEFLDSAWGPAREVRANQPLLALSERSHVPVDLHVRPARAADLDTYLPAATSMFIEEVGIDPGKHDGGGGFRRRVAKLIASQRAWVWYEDGEILFKAEVGALSRRVGQIQGVWVNPRYRGRGIGTIGTAVVANAIVASGRIASLYVNDFNLVARAAYKRVGFEQVGTYATVLLD